MAIIELNNVTKQYRLGQFHGPLFKALDDVSFNVEKGEVLGIIGMNGAGKSTILKLLSKIIVPTKGKVSVRGKVAPLIELGAGLNPELTGRENIYLNAAIMGLSYAQIKKKFDGIVHFAELEEFIDTPVKRYSSGMSVRLGFSIATAIDADILIVDEVLAVGDLAFQRKCFDRMEDMIKRQGKTVLLVSHNIRQVVRLCSRTILLETGKILKDGKSGEVCDYFYELSNKKIMKRSAEMRRHNVQKSGEVDLLSIELLDRSGKPTTEPVMNEPLKIRAIFKVEATIEEPEIVFGFHTSDFVYISSMTMELKEGKVSLRPGLNTIECEVKSLPLIPGVYYIRVGILKHRRVIYYAEMLSQFIMAPGKISVARMPELGIVYIPTEWSISQSGEK